MKTPPFLSGACVLFWGWYTHLFPLAVIMAVVLEAARIVQARWELSFADFQRISNICAALLIGILIYRVTTSSFLEVAFLSIQWFPIVLFPLLAAQLYSTAGVLDLRTLFRLFLPKAPAGQPETPTTVNLSYPFVMLCLLSASVANARSHEFYAGFLLLILWGLWGIRSRRYSLIVWGMLMLLAMTGGYLGQRELFALQLALERSQFILNLATGMSVEDTDPYQTSTAIGAIGTVKLANRALFRVKAESGPLPGVLLREATYNAYRSTKWYAAARTEFKDVPPEPDRATWVLQPDSTHSQRLTIALPLKKGTGLLKLPTGTLRLENLLVGNLGSNVFGVLKVLEGPDLLTHQTIFRANQGALDGPPDEHDRLIPPEEQAGIDLMVQEIGLSTLSREDAVAALLAFFQEQFAYSLRLPRQIRSRTPLTDFLLQSRSGHCEYFATSAVLLLRAIGIPARYAVGYALDTLDQPGKWEFVRGRDAHAWVVAYWDGAWHDVDPTPAIWRPIEKQRASRLEGLSDVWATITFTFTDWRQREITGQIIRVLLIASIPVLLALSWRWYAQKRKKKVAPSIAVTPEAPRYPGLDSAFYLIEQRLQALGFERYAWEPLSMWLLRLERQPVFQALPSLRDLLNLHYRYRFDPNGLPETEQTRLAATVQSWLQQSDTLAGAVPPSRKSL